MIGLLTKDNDIKRSLRSLNVIDIDDTLPIVNALFIDWMNDKSASKEFALQGVIIKHYTKKGVPITIYDRYMSINQKEYEWLKKFNNVKLFEPALNNRVGFGYIPHWIKPITYMVEEKDNSRSVDLGYCGSRDISSFGKYYLEYVKKYNTRSVIYENVEWSNVNFTVAIGSENDYNIGYLNSNVIDAINNGCMVLCPIEHKYYVGMFYEYTVNNIDLIEYFVSLENNEMKQACLLSLYDRISNSYPEFLLENAINTLSNSLKR
jgi:hypothetical protein